MLRKRLKQELDILLGRKSRIKKTVHCPYHWYGNSYGGFYANPELLGPEAIVYSFGIGQDISFGTEIIEKHHCKVFGFDPTPKSIDWVKKQICPEGYQFYPFGIGTETGMVSFQLPKNQNHVSGSMVSHDQLDEKNSITVPMKSLADITAALGHQKIDVLKMDIEGAEYAVAETVLNTGVEIHQILLELHERFFADGTARTQKLFQALDAAGYGIFAVSDSLEEVSFIRRDLVGLNR